MIDETVTEGVRQGQSLHHIYIADASLKSLCNERTIRRRLCYRGNLSVKPHELRRYVRYKREYLKGHKDIAPRDIRVLLGRTYKDYLRKSSSNKRMNVVQYDSVIGKLEDTLAILTITFPKYNFQFGRVITKGDTKSVNAAIRKIFLDIGIDNVKRIFPINLADNGLEFISFSKIEITSYGEKICDTYYTNPYKATDKAECERCHELVRYCLPKGKSLNSINQEMLDEMFSNINSYTREPLHDQTPYALVLRKYGKAFLEAIRIHRVNKKKVKLTQLV
jgi:IS30 family transposase